MTIVAMVAASLLAVQTPGVQSFDVRAGPADQAINRLAAQAGIDVVIRMDLGRRRSSALSGRMSTETALERLLRPLGARAVQIGAGVYRVEVAPSSRPRAPQMAVPTPAPTATELSEIVVTAMPPVGLAGEAGWSPIGTGSLERVEGSPASEAIADLSATVDSTRQGIGRNKLFVRGLADSAANGPLQATVGQYFGDLRLSFGSPDPDLILIDIGRIEVFEGPQGTRFGTGSIGGVIRLHPKPPAPDEGSTHLSIGAGVTSSGGESSEAALVLNGPFGDRVAARLVAYGRREGGFLDNPIQDLRETDRVDTVGGRAALRWTKDAWTIDLVGVAQRVRAGDTQAIASSEARFARFGLELEPYESGLLLAGVTATRRVGAVRLTSATSVSQQYLQERFDAGQRFGPLASVVDRHQTATTASTELKVDTDPFGGWKLTGGAAVTFAETLVERRHLDLSGTPNLIFGTDLRRTFAEATAFGEASFSPAPNWRFAAGGRVSVVHVDSSIRDVGAVVSSSPNQEEVSVGITPGLSARWDASRAVTIFARFEQAVRPAGVSDTGGAFDRYQGDRVTLIEAGVRSRDWRDDLSAELSVGWVDWRDVQADIVSPGGDLVTDNVGDGVIHFVSMKAAWYPTPTTDLSAGLFINDSHLTPTRPNVIGGGRTDIPNVAPIGVQLSLSHDAGLVAGLPLRLGADLRYVGQSRLGVGPALDVPQGGYLRSELTARLGDERTAATLRISNPFDQSGIRYGIGSPYQLSEPQVVPVRPLTVRLTFDAAF